jgi:hypothetical protein
MNLLKEKNLPNKYAPLMPFFQVLKIHWILREEKIGKKLNFPTIVNFEVNI